MKFRVKVETTGYDEFVVEAPNLAAAEKNWEKDGLFQGDNCEEATYGGYREHVGDPEIKKIEDEEELFELLGNTKTRESSREIRMTINEFVDGKYDIRVDLETETHDVDIVPDKDKFYNKHEAIAKINKFLVAYLSKKTRHDVMGK